MNWDSEKCIEYYYGEYKNGIFIKKYNMRLGIYPSRIEGVGFQFFDNELSKDVHNFEI